MPSSEEEHPSGGAEMPRVPALPGLLSSEEISKTAGTIREAQEASGFIPDSPGSEGDPWDHVECAMALSAANEWQAATQAYEWLRVTQRADGTWPMRNRANGEIVDSHAGTNQSAYVATGVWHHVSVTGDDAFARRMWPMVEGAMDFVTDMQAPEGQIWWLRNEQGDVAEEALLTGCSSTHQSLRCAAALADYVGQPRPQWREAADRLAEAITERPELFADKSRYSMDWYYPILGGILDKQAAQQRLADHWGDFVVPELGVKCVADEPWVTGAETCEFVLALDAIGAQNQPRKLLHDMQYLREKTGEYWMGYVYRDGEFWPEEHTTWTAAAVVLATDALAHVSGGSGIFRNARQPEALVGGQEVLHQAAAETPQRPQ
jgi:hypothetical protein